MDIRKSDSISPPKIRDIEESRICSKHGGTVALCVCQQSQRYPLCDRTHETFNRETGSSIEPLVVHLQMDKALVEIKSGGKTHTHTLETSVLRNRKHNKVDETETRVPHSTGTRSVDEEAQKKNRREDVPDKEIPATHEEVVNKSNENILKPSEVPQGETAETTTTTAPKKKRPLQPVDKKSITAVYTAEEVAKHCTKDDLWMIIKGNVYDVTPYVEHHPGGLQALLNFAGKDGTENVQFHSSQMLKLLDKYFYIGKLKKEEEEQHTCGIM